MLCGSRQKGDRQLSFLSGIVTINKETGYKHTFSDCPDKLIIYLDLVLQLQITNNITNYKIGQRLRNSDQDNLLYQPDRKLSCLKKEHEVYRGI